MWWLKNRRDIILTLPALLSKEVVHEVMISASPHLNLTSQLNAVYFLVSRLLSGTLYRDGETSQVHEKWIEFGGRPSDDMKVKLTGGPLFEIAIACFISGFRRASDARCYGDLVLKSFVH